MRVAVIGICCLLWSSLLFAQTPAETYIGSVRLELGTPESFVAAELAPKFTLKLVGGTPNGSQVYFVKNNVGDDAGMVFFDEEKLSGASSTLYTGLADEEFANSLYESTRSFVADAGTTCSINTISDFHEKMNGTAYACGSRELLVTFVVKGGSKTATISDVIGEARNR